ncbi:MAG TPA: sulfocyanin-like copper-binding protein [Gemmatimonadales bacterium]|nr:sulfocyanin-like copper-binding protein [Gemmatimonadales bacterium]
MRRFSVLTLLLILGITVIGAAQTTDTSSAKGGDGSKALSYDAATKTVTFGLVAGAPGGKGGPFNFNGYTSGAATLTVPAGSKVVMNFVNEDGTPHSAVVVGGDGALPNIGGDPAIPGAYTRDVTQGLAQFGKDVLKFTAPANGTFRIICGVPGHALSGMWIWLKIDPATKTPSFGESK